MTRDERIEKVEAILGSSILPTTQIKAYARAIVDALEPEDQCCCEICEADDA